MDVTETFRSLSEIGVISALLFFLVKAFVARDTKRDEQMALQHKNYVEREQILLAEATRREEILRLEAEKREKILRQEAEKREANLMLAIEGYGRTMEKISSTMDGIQGALAELKTAHMQMENKVTNIERRVSDGREGHSDC